MIHMMSLFFSPKMFPVAWIFIISLTAMSWPFIQLVRY